jgi:hypothetical protein
MLIKLMLNWLRWHIFSLTAFAAPISAGFFAVEIIHIFVVRCMSLCLHKINSKKIANHININLIMHGQPHLST